MELVALASTVLFAVIIIVKSFGLQSLKGHLGAKGIAYFPISSPPVLSSHQDNDTKGSFPPSVFCLRHCGILPMGSKKGQRVDIHVSLYKY